ncbi:MAG: glycosyltransferase [Methylocystaceae bacterium]
MTYRVLLLTPYLYSRRGNSYTARRLAHGLNKAGLELLVVSMETPDWQDQLEYALASQQWHLLHGLNATSVGLALAALPALKELPLLLTLTGTDLNNDLGNPNCQPTAPALNQAQKLVVFNEFHFDRLGALNRDWRLKTKVIPQGVNLPPAEPMPRCELGIREEATVFLISGGLRPVKNIELAFEGLALAYTEDTNLQLMLVGGSIDWDYSQKILGAVNKLPWVLYAGEYPHHEIAGVISQSDIVLNTSISEGQPQAVLEAMSLGRPCLLHAVPGNIGLITEGHGGYYFHNPQELSARALQLMHNNSLKQRMGRAARQTIELKHNPQQEIEAYLNLYDEMLAKA